MVTRATCPIIGERNDAGDISLWRQCLWRFTLCPFKYTMLIMIWIDTRALYLVFIDFQIRITAMSNYGVHIMIIEGKLKIA